jgi:precorrin-8X/cobalt-precorrin-8 methylmutase
MQYIRDPERIRQQNLEKIRELVPLETFTPEQQEVVIAMVDAWGEPELAKYIRFSENAIKSALKAIKQRNTILHDEELLAHALDSNLLYQEPLSFLGKASVISLAKANKQTRAMTSVDFWKPHLGSSIVLIGQSATALLRLLEIIREGAPKPALIISAARGFILAENAKNLLWQQHQELGFECIMVDGMRGGSVLVAAAMNALLRLHQEKHAGMPH